MKGVLLASTESSFGKRPSASYMLTTEIPIGNRPWTIQTTLLSLESRHRIRQLAPPCRTKQFQSPLSYLNYCERDENQSVRRDTLPLGTSDVKASRERRSNSEAALALAERGHCWKGKANGPPFAFRAPIAHDRR